MTHLFQIHPNDNTAVLLDDGVAGEVVTSVDRAHAVTLRDEIAYGHKVALADIPQDADILKYGTPIGHASQPIRAGEWVHLHNCASNYDSRSASLDVHSGATTDTVYE